MAEAILVLGIIGVIALVTLPVIIGDYKEKEIISKVKKNYSDITQTLILNDDMLQLKTGGTYQELKNWFDKNLKPYLLLSKVCYNESGCWNTTGAGAHYYDSSLGSFYDDNLDLYGSDIGCGDSIITGILNDGTYINIDFWLQEHIWTYFGVETNQKQALTIYFDINGNSKPNTFGKDIFVLLFTEKGFLLPCSDDLDRIDSNCSSWGYCCIWKYLNK